MFTDIIESFTSSPHPSKSPSYRPHFSNVNILQIHAKSSLKCVLDCRRFASESNSMRSRVLPQFCSPLIVRKGRGVQYACVRARRVSHQVNQLVSFTKMNVVILMQIDSIGSKNAEDKIIARSYWHVLRIGIHPNACYSCTPCECWFVSPDTFTSSVSRVFRSKRRLKTRRSCNSSP